MAMESNLAWLKPRQRILQRRGHRLSIRLEEEFWEQLEFCAKDEGVKLSELVFRLILLSLLVILGADLLRFDRATVAFLGILLTSLAFAAHHSPGGGCGTPPPRWPCDRTRPTGETRPVQRAAGCA